MTLFSLPFVGIGGSMLWRAWRTFVSARPDLIFLQVEWLFGVVFSFVGLALLAIGWFGKQVAEGQESPLAIRKRLMGIKSGPEEWQIGRLTSPGKGAVIGGWVAFAFSAILLAPVVWIAWSRGAMGGEAAYRPWCASTVIPAAFLIKAIYRTLRLQKYGASICEIQRKPSALNGEFTFVIRPEQATLPDGDARLYLRCEKREMQGTGKGRHLQKTVLWKEEQRVPVQSVGLGIPGRFVIPAELPEAAHKMNEGIYWILEASGATRGIDYFASFDLAFKR